jgi:dienelactone hydrolase
MALCAASSTASAQTLALDATDVGGPGSRKAGELYMPAGAGPFPGVVLLQGCDGVNANDRAWARRLVGWGYAALIVDSFGPRGIGNICNRGATVPASLRAADASEGARYLHTLPAVSGQRIGLIGFSHGAGGALQASSGWGGAFAATIAFYPLCGAGTPSFSDDVLVIMGGADDWTPSQRCADAVARYPANAAHRPTLKVYAGGTHGFDSARPSREYFGHHLAYDPAAAADAIATTHRFLTQRLGR